MAGSNEGGTDGGEVFIKLVEKMLAFAEVVLGNWCIGIRVHVCHVEIRLQESYQTVDALRRAAEDALVPIGSIRVLVGEITGSDRASAVSMRGNCSSKLEIVLVGLMPSN